MPIGHRGDGPGATLEALRALASPFERGRERVETTASPHEAEETPAERDSVEALAPSLRARTLPSGKTLRRMADLQFGLCGSVAGVLIIGFISLLLRVPPDRLRELQIGFACAVPILTLLVSWIRVRATRPLIHCLDELAAGTASMEVVRRGFATAIDLPRLSFVVGLLATAGGSAGAILVLNLVLDDFRASTTVLILLTASSCGLLSNVVLYYIQKHGLEPVRNGLASLLPDPDERSRLIRPFPVFWKLVTSIVAVVIVPLVFTTFLAYSQVPSSGEALAARIQEKILQRALSGEPKLKGDLLELAGADVRALDLPFALVLLDVATGDVVGGPAEALSESESRWIRDAAAGGDAATHGGADRLYSANILRWQLLPSASHSETGADGAARQLALVILGARDALLSTGHFADFFAGLIVAAALLAFGIAWMIGRDFCSAAESLQNSARIVAAGDLQSGEVFESEDEMGGVGRGLARMAGALRMTVGLVAQSADRMEDTAGQMATLSASAGATIGQQAEAVEQAHNSMEQINVSISSIAESANSLNELVEQSSSSILEMSAAGEELNQTAGSMSEKVDDVSASISQISLSVKKVWGTTETLSEAATETASSMLQMASAMRHVDENAEHTSTLSKSVIEAAERGQSKVRETILGMEQIRAATETAEQVIRSLGNRASEIGSILDVIDDVADETNLLALNASIIAAQAGEHGRAFSVVAGQIKQLADRVLSNTKEIGDRIRSVQDESANAILAIENGGEIVAAGAKLSSEAGVSLAEITSAARDTGSRIGEILSAVREQSKAASHVVAMMESVNEGVAQIRFASAEQTTGHEAIALTSEALRHVAQQLLATTREQARGAQLIRSAIEGVRDAGEEIHGALQTQSSSCTDAAEFLEAVASRNRESRTSARRLEEVTSELVQEADQLGEAVRRFRL